MVASTPDGDRKARGGEGGGTGPTADRRDQQIRPDPGRQPNGESLAQVEEGWRPPGPGRARHRGSRRPPIPTMSEGPVDPRPALVRAAPCARGAGSGGFVGEGVTRALERHREQFHADPARSLSFEALEEHHFLASEWEELALLYARRLEAPALRQRGAERVRLLFRLGQILEERCGDPARALQRYRQAVELEPSFGPALRQLRRIYSAPGQWELVLQVAEVEGALPMHPYEASAFHAELGQVWAERMNDAAEALVHFDRALESSPGAEAAPSGPAP